jgi:hypothetical protein
VSLVREHRKLRPQPPRLKNTKARERSGERSRNQDAQGRFTPGNDAPKGRAVKQLIKRQLGAGATGELVERLFSDTLELFRALKRSVGSEAPAVQDTLARRARWSVLSAHFALRAAEQGLETESGQRCLDLALKLDARAERLDVTALDLAERLPDPSKPETDPHSAMLEAFGAPAPVRPKASPAARPTSDDPSDAQSEPLGGEQ